MSASQECKAQEYLGGFEALKRTGPPNTSLPFSILRRSPFPALRSFDLNLTIQRLPPPLVTEPEAIWAQPWPQAPEYYWRRALESLSRSAEYSRLWEGHFIHAPSEPAHETLPSPHLNQLLHSPNLGSREPHTTHASRVPDEAAWDGAEEHSIP
ncbi:hypothetical protein B0H11DRAFT_2275250 [Mycena galericulata]|nr:hypothetical protein B0H11DRAFT_2275250 [Mycena galericulata]